MTTRSASDRKPSGHTIQLTRHVKITQEIYVDYTDVSFALSFKIQGTLAVMPIKCPLMPNTFEVIGILTVTTAAITNVFQLQVGKLPYLAWHVEGKSAQLVPSRENMMAHAEILHGG